MSEDPIAAAVRTFYERWVTEVYKEDRAIGGRLPGFEDLTGEQVLDWMAAYAATVEVGYKMARASVGVMVAAA